MVAQGTVSFETRSGGWRATKPLGTDYPRSKGFPTEAAARAWLAQQGYGGNVASGAAAPVQPASDQPQAGGPAEPAACADAAHAEPKREETWEREENRLKLHACECTLTTCANINIETLLLRS